MLADKKKKQSGNPRFGPRSSSKKQAKPIIKATYEDNLCKIAGSLEQIRLCSTYSLESALRTWSAFIKHLCFGHVRQESPPVVFEGPHPDL